MKAPRAFSDPTVLLVLTLVLAGVAASGKPSVNLARLLLGVAWIVALIGFYNLPPLRRRPALLTGAAVVAAAALIWVAWWIQPQPTPSNVGHLTNTATSSIRTIFPPTGQGEIRVQIGDSTSSIVYAGAAGTPMFSVAEESNLIVEEVNGELLVSSLIKERSGNLIAELNRNEWTTFSPAVDRNYTKDALEVRGPHGRIVLQVRLHPDRIQLQGEWWSQDGVGLRIVGRHGEQGMLYKMITPGDAVKPPHIQPLFKYPSATYLGKFATE